MTIWVIRALVQGKKPGLIDQRFLCFDEASGGYAYWSDSMYGVRFYTDFRTAREEFQKYVREKYANGDPPAGTIHTEISEIQFVPHWIHKL